MQIKVYAAKPMPITNGHLVLTLDSTVFGTGAMVGLFGANGDATGLATTTGPKIDVQFSSATGGIGQLAGLPVMVVSVPVLASAAGKTVTVSATSPDASVTVASGSVTVRGTLSVQKIYAGMGVVPAGTVVPVYGSGFTASTAVTMDGVEIASTKLISAGEVDVTLGGATELVGKLARVTDGGVEFDYFFFQPNDPVNFPSTSYFGAAVANVQPMFPLAAANGFTGFTGGVGGLYEVQNPNPAAATVRVTNLNQYGTGLGGTPVTIPAGSWTLISGQDDSTFVGISDLPVRVVGVAFCGPGVGLPVCLAPISPYDNATEDPVPTVTPSSLEFAWQMGSSTLPQPRQIVVNTPYLGTIKFTVTAGASWLSPGGGLVSVNPTQLTAAGTYQGSILISQNGLTSVTLPVTLTVTNTAVPLLSINTASINFTAPSIVATPYSQTIAVTSDSGPTPFLVALPYGTFLKVSPMSGMTPATLTVTWDPAVTSQYYPEQSSTTSSLSISGLANTVTIPTTFNVTGVQTFQTFLGESGLGPNGLVFSAQTGSAAQTQTINVFPTGTISAAADQPWMSLTVPTSGTNANQAVVVTVSPAGLAAGVYSGTVTVGEAGLASIAVPVTLAIYANSPPLTFTRSSFTFVETAGEPAPPYQTGEADTGGIAVPLTVSTSASWVYIFGQSIGPTPAQIRVWLTNAPQELGEYTGSFTIQSPGASINVPVTLLVEPGPATPPVVSQVVNGASEIAGGVSPGEILTIRGYSVGASAISGVKLDPSGSVVTQSNGVGVTFDGQAAPLIYTSAYQTNLIVPYEVAGKTSTVMQVTYAAAGGTVQTAAWVLPVVATAPGVFTIDATGTGQGAIVNQDGTVNSATNPAARGSVVSIYATGEGQTIPPGITGSVTQSDLKKPVLSVAATIGGADAVVQYAGSAPDSIAGLMQVNVVVPQGINANTAVPINITVGGTQSQAGVTLAVK